MKSWFDRFVRWCPGALGLLLRRMLYSRILKSCGKGVLIGRFVELYAPEKMEIGDRVMLNNSVVLDAGDFHRSGPAMVIEQDVFVGTGTHLQAGSNGSITIQAGTSISSFCNLAANVPLNIGRDCLIAAYCNLGVLDAGQGEISVVDDDRYCRVKNTVVGDGCWLGVRMELAAGVIIGGSTIIGAHAVVESDLPEYSVAVGRPASVLWDRRSDGSSLESRSTGMDR